MDSIDGIRIEADEDGFELILEGDFEETFEKYLGNGNDREASYKHVRLRLQPAAWEFAGSQGLRELLAWREEGEQALIDEGRRERAAGRGQGYPRDDPKHPDWHANVSALHDQRPDR